MLPPLANSALCGPTTLFLAPVRQFGLILTVRVIFSLLKVPISLRNSSCFVDIHLEIFQQNRNFTIFVSIRGSLENTFRNIVV